MLRWKQKFNFFMQILTPPLHCTFHYFLFGYVFTRSLLNLRKRLPWSINVILRLGHSRPLFSLFSSFQQLTENLFIIKSCQWLDSNCGTLVSEATILPSEPQPLPKVNQCYNWTIHNCNLNCTSPNWNLYLFTTTLEM